MFYGSKDMSAVLNCIANPKDSSDTDIIDASKEQSYCSGTATNLKSRAPVVKIISLV